LPSARSLHSRFRFVRPPKLTAIDDGFYYLRVASIFVRSGAWTYDGVTITNGFHPLWELAVTGLAAVFRDEMALLRATYALSWALQGIGLAFLLRAFVATGVYPVWPG